MRSIYLFAWIAASLIGTSGCSSDDDQDDTIACRQKADADHDDCEGRDDLRTRKMDCDTEAQESEARAAGCVAEDESNTESNDMCCPPSVSGTPD